MCAGVSLTITPLLSLGADQTQKICRNTSINGSPVHAYHLDELWCPKAQKLLSDQLLLLSIDTDVTVFLFSSPQAIVNNQIWRPIIGSLITKRLLSMLCIDEVHLFVQFRLSLIDYAVEWEKVMVARVSAGLIKAEQLRVELDHYQHKVDSLRQSANATMAKGEQVDGKSAERLTRNEDKLIKNKADHTKFMSALCLLIEEVTEQSWSDLHPLLVKSASKTSNKDCIITTAKTLFR